MKSSLSALARVIVGGLFIFAGYTHAVQPATEFAAVLEAYALIPNDYLLAFAAVMPWAQLLLGTYLFVGFFTKFSAASIGLLLLVFEAALLSTKARGIPLEHCGCFGSSIPLTPGQTMVLDLLLLGLAVLAWQGIPHKWSVDQWLSQTTTPHPTRAKS